MVPFGRFGRFILSAGCAVCVLGGGVASQTVATLAVVGATVIDGSGGAPLVDATVVVQGERITAVGLRATTAVPAGATRIDGAGKFVTPGFIDTNVHVSLYGGQNERYETMVRYQPRFDDIVIEAAQIDLAHGITTVRDSYGALVPLVRGRDAINAGRVPGARILAAGNILGWSGPYSFSFSRVMGPLTLFQEQMNDFIAQGAGEELMNMTPDEIARAIDAYVDKRPDFLKYGGTSHFSEPTFVGFSLAAQRALVDAGHRRGMFVETHATSVEGLRESLAAGIDGIQHPEILDGRPLPEDVIRTIVDRRIVCSMLVNTITGAAWERHVKARAETEKRLADAAARPGATREKTTAERRKDAAGLGEDLEQRRRNAIALMRAGALVTPGTDSYWAAAPELTRTPKAPEQDHGTGTWAAIEGFVELGFTPLQALTAATRSGAAAARLERDLGTLTPGKRADLLVLAADPLADIRNIRRVETVIKDGRVIDRAALPTQRILSAAR